MKWPKLLKYVEAHGPRSHGPDASVHFESFGHFIPVRGFHDWLISAQVRVGTGGGRISRILSVPRVSQ